MSTPASPRRWIAAPVFLLVFISSTAHAVDLYSLFDSSCRRHTGVLAHVDDQRVVLVDLEGAPVWVARASIQHLVLHQVLENPLEQITPSTHLSPLLRQVWTEKTERPSFGGWVSGFHDDLLIFFDSEGKTHVLQASEIVRIRPWSPDRPLSPTIHRTPLLGFPPTIVPCSAAAHHAPMGEPTSRPAPAMPTSAPSVGDEPGAPALMPSTLPAPLPAAPAVPTAAADDAAILPSRVIADRIKIDDLLTAMAEHYRNVAALEERTHVYARPYHFEPTLRLGLTYSEHAGYSEYFPFYVHYTGGMPYRFQSRIMLGQMVHEALPFMRPTLSASSDIKSHFFHVTFVGHLPALPAESNPFLTDTGELLQEDEGRYPEMSGPIPGRELQDEPEALQQITVTTSYNYLILMGVDYWRLSASFGPAFFSMAVQSRLPGTPPINGYILATAASPVFRLQYRAERWQARALYYRTRMSGPISSEMGDFTDGEEETKVFCETSSDAFRLGVTAQLPLEITVSLDEILTIGSIEAKVDPSSLPFDFGEEPITIPLSFMRSETTLMVGAQFGRYIAVKAYMRLLARRFHLDMAGLPPQNLFEALFGGALEFVFY